MIEPEACGCEGAAREAGAAPALVGGARIGAPLEVDLGSWLGAGPGDGDAVVSLQWRCDGAEIPGATGARFIPGPAEEGVELSCVVTAATAAGARVAATPPVRVAHAAPVARSEIFDEILDGGAGDWEIDAASAFAGAGLRYAVSGAGAAIDAATGRLRIATDRPLSGEEITVTAMNSGGEAALRFRVTVEAGEDAPPAAGPGDWTLEAGARGPVLALAPGLGAVEAEWIAGDVAGIDEFDLEGLYRPAAPLGAGRWRAEGLSAADLSRGAGPVWMRYRAEAGGPWSPRSRDGRDFLTLASGEAEAPGGGPEPEGWSLMAFRSIEEVELGYTGGCQEQFWHGMARSKTHPDILAGGQDMGGVWISENDGRNWRHAGCEGLKAPMMSGVAIDPADPDVWVGVGGSIYLVASANFNGIYKSTDRGRTWALKQMTPDVHHQRVPHNVVWDPTTEAGPAGSRVWYAGLVRRSLRGDELGSELWRSADGGETWVRRAAFPVEGPEGALRGRFHNVWHHPSVSDAIWLCTDAGLFASRDGGLRWEEMGGRGRLPRGAAFRLEVNPQDGDEMYVVAGVPTGQEGGTIWRTVDGGARWEEIHGPAAPLRGGGVYPGKIYVHAVDGAWPPVERRRLYLMSKGGLGWPDGQLRVSDDGGRSWERAEVSTLPTPWWQADPNWFASIGDSTGGGARPGMIANILPHPTDPARAFAHARGHNFRTEDGGRNWSYSGEGFTGTAWGCYKSSVSFTNDPEVFAFGRWDVGMIMTTDGGHSFVAKPHGGEVGPGGASVHNSTHAITLHPEHGDVMFCSLGIFGQPQYLFEVRRLRSAEPVWIRRTDETFGGRFAHWHRRDPAVIYLNEMRSTDGGATFRPYPSEPGSVVAALPSDEDVLYSWQGERESLRILISEDRGEHWSEFVRVGYNLAHDLRFTNVYPHPRDRDILFLRTQRGDLARYNRATGQWKTDYGLRQMVQRLHPDIPEGYSVQIGDVTMDPADPDVMWVAMAATGHMTVLLSLNAQSEAPDWRDVTFDLPRCFPFLVEVNPHDGRCFLGANGFGSTRVFPSQRRTHGAG